MANADAVARTAAADRVLTRLASHSPTLEDGTASPRAADFEKLADTKEELQAMLEDYYRAHAIELPAGGLAPVLDRFFGYQLKLEAIYRKKYGAGFLLPAVNSVNSPCS